MLVDGAQAVPHAPVDVQALGADFFVFSGHKTFGPTGIGALWGREEWLERLPPYQGGGDMIDRVTFEGTTFAGLPSKFEAGTPHVAGGIGLGTALDYLEGVGMEAIAAYEDDLIAYAEARLLEVEGMRFVGTPKKRAGAISFLVDDIHPYDAGSVLDRLGHRGPHGPPLRAARSWTASRCRARSAPRSRSITPAPTSTRLSRASGPSARCWDRFRVRVLRCFARRHCRESCGDLEADGCRDGLPSRTLNPEPLNSEPPMTESDRRQQEIVDEFSFLDDWMLRFQQVIEHGEAMDPLPDDAKTDDRLVRGCQSRVWLDADLEGDTFRARADSESQIVRGLASLLVRVFDGLEAEEARAVEVWFPKEIGLAEHLSPNRANGFDAMRRALEAAAKTA